MDSLRFGQITDLAVDTEGRIYVGDTGHSAVQILASDGTFLRSVEQEGGFSTLTTVATGPEDSLFVYEVGRQRISVYAPKKFGDEAYTIHLRSRANFGGTKGIPLRIFLLDQSEFLVHYSEPHSPWQKKDHGKVSGLGVINSQGQFVIPRILTIPRRQSFFAVFDGKSIPKGRMSIYTSMPFGRRPIIEVTSTDRILYGWSDSLSVGVYNLKGREIARFNKSQKPRPIRERTVDQYLDNVELPVGDRDSKMVRHKKIPDAWPAFFAMVTDDRRRMWLKTDTAKRSGRSAWAIIDLETGKQEATAVVSGSVSLHVIRNGIAYGVQSQANIEKVVTYRVEELLGEMR